jgi:hypothetical protein
MTIIHGVGINDADYKSLKRCPFYKRWVNLIGRCYGGHEPDYEDCSVCEDWLTFSKFRAWMETQKWRGQELDKDILVFGNKIYSPETCVFIPMPLNKLFRKYPANKSGLPRGVSKQTRYVALAIINGARVELGRFDDPMDAHIAWLRSRHLTVIGVANTYKGKLRDALLWRAERILDHINRREPLEQI